MADIENALPQDEPAEEESLWQKLLKHLKYILLVIALLAAFLFGAIKGCAAFGGAFPLLPESSASASVSAAASQGE